MWVILRVLLSAPYPGGVPKKVRRGVVSTIPLHREHVLSSESIECAISNRRKGGDRFNHRPWYTFALRPFAGVVLAATVVRLGSRG